MILGQGVAEQIFEQLLPKKRHGEVERQIDGNVPATGQSTLLHFR